MATGGDKQRHALWGGRFAGAQDALFKQFNDSLRFDWRLAPHDIELSIAWAEALGGAGVLTGDEVASLRGALAELAGRVRSMPHPPLDSGAEDVHSWVEAQLVERIGTLGKKLHTGRSRNDQVATGLRLWTRAAIDARVAELRALAMALVDLAEAESATPMPAYTHLQRAQPVVVGHWALAYVEMLERDIARLAAARARADLCPLGSAALAGTTYRIDRESLAKRLGFAGCTRNSLDAVSDRDFVVEALAAASIAATHLSRFAEEIVIFSSAEFGLIALDDAVTSGSSLMPQKKNPDAAELIRGKCGRIVGDLVALLTTLKGLPLAYNKDMQEDKEPLFDGLDQLGACVMMAERVVRATRFDRAACLAAAAAGHACATELADHLVSRGVPFRDAHEQVGRLVRVAIERGVELGALTPAEMRAHAPAVGNDVGSWLTVEASLARRDVEGGTSPSRVKKAVAAARRRLSQGA